MWRRNHAGCGMFSFNDWNVVHCNYFSFSGSYGKHCIFLVNKDIFLPSSHVRYLPSPNPWEPNNEHLDWGPFIMLLSYWRCFVFKQYYSCVQPDLGLHIHVFLLLKVGLAQWNLSRNICVRLQFILLTKCNWTHFICTVSIAIKNWIWIYLQELLFMFKWHIVFILIYFNKATVRIHHRG